MKKIIFITLCFLAFTAHLSFSQTITTEHLFIQKNGSATAHEISAQYSIYNQAKFRNLIFEIIDSESANPKLKISGKIKNILSRNLLNAEVIITCSGPEEAIAPMQKKILPRLIKQGEQSRNFSVEINYTKEISSCTIDVTWQGKATH